MIRQYKKHIAENRNLIYFSTLIALLLRWVSFGFVEETAVKVYDDSFLWAFISPLFSNVYVSAISAFLFSIVLSLYILRLNDKYALIRIRTALPYVFLIFLTSCMPSLLYMSPYYLVLLFVLFLVDVLYSSYRKEKVADVAFRIGFLLALGSMFSFDFLLYIPLFWLGFVIVRSFNYKAIFAFLLGMLMVYWIAAFGYIYIHGFENPLGEWLNKWSNYSFPSINDRTIAYWVILVINTLIIAFIIIHYYVYSYKDKVQTRAYISFVNFLFVYSLLLSIVLLLNPGVSILMLLMASSFIYSHYFALIDQKGSVYFFICVILFFLMQYLYTLQLY